MNSADKQVVLHCLRSMIDEELCEECPLYGMTVTDHCEKDCVRLALNALSRSENPNKWIPVSERLPEAGEYIGDVARYYLVQNEFGDMMVARYTHSEYWEQIYQLKPIVDEIVAWMPLPEPYKTSPTGSEGSDKE